MPDRMKLTKMKLKTKEIESIELEIQYNNMDVRGTKKEFISSSNVIPNKFEIYKFKTLDSYRLAILPENIDLDLNNYYNLYIPGPR